MKITFLGGADEVGASSTLLEIGGKHILVDCGIRPSPRARGGLAGDQLPHLDTIKKLDAILVTHAHTDHTGALELVVGRFPGVPVYATAPTIALTRVLHQDARRIMQNRLDEEGELPLFDDVAVQGLMDAFVPVPFKSRLPLGEGLAATFFPAGHIAGAGMLGLESDEGNLLITGDFSISPQRTVDGARPPAFRPDVLLVESTYGGRLHANRAVQERKLIDAVAKVIGEGGKVLIPAFALGRAQEILLILSEFQRRGELPMAPVWADGMVRAICQAYTSFAEALPLALQERGAKFFEGSIRPVQTAEQRNALIWQPGAAVIVASSGMLAGGPSLAYARALATSPQHAILLTGYQDEESPGRRLQEVAERGHGTIRLGREKDGQEVRVDVQCHLGTYSLSAHADEGQIISLVETLHPEHVLLVHGDETARASLEKALGERSRMVHLPYAGQSLEFGFETRKRVKSSQPEEIDWRVQQMAVAQARRTRMGDFSQAVGKWLLLHGDMPTPVRCLALESDHLWVEVAPGLEQAAYPEEILKLLGDSPPDATDLAVYQPQPASPVLMEPNQALTYANQQFPPEVRLRKTGYRLDQHILALTFDFPDVAREQYRDKIVELQSATGWQVEVILETNQAALNTLAREVLPDGWQVVKGPAIYREQKRVAVTVTAPPSESVSPMESAPLLSVESQITEICARFQAISGYELSINLVERVAPPVILPIASAQERLEINAAYSMIKTALEGSTLYRTSLKGDEIVLSFISRQVGERYQEVIADLVQRTGWWLSINPQPNQGAILEAARKLLSQSGWTINKGPGIYPEKSEVVVGIAEAPGKDFLSQAASAFMDLTGFQMTISTPQSPAPVIAPSETSNIVEIPMARIRLNRYQQGLTLDPLKIDKAVERARRMGITPPITVRRAREDYLLVDGLYRLRAAEALGMERIPAVVE
jgi:Cft2 family RNA processing exonuclease